MTETFIIKHENDKELDQAKAEAYAVKVDRLISDLLTAEARLENDYAQLGNLLLTVHRNLYWKYMGHKSFGDYMNSLSEKYNKGRSQLYHYFSTVRTLEPYINQEQLSAMGIAKAAEVAKSTKRTGFPPTPETIEKATDAKITAANLRKILFIQDNIPPDEKGLWLDQQGFYITEDEKMVIESADELALKVDPPVQPDSPDWVKRKEARLRQAMEFLGSHENA